MIRVIKGTLALAGLVGLGLLLRWFTAGSISGLRTYDLDSLTVLAVGTVAWIAYGWLVLAVVLTALEQIPGAVGALAGAIAGRITTKTARALLRSGLGVAAVTPLTVSAAHAAPSDTAHVQQWTNPATTNNYRATEPRSAVELGGSETAPEQVTRPRADYRATEPASTVQLGGQEPAVRGTESTANTDDYRATEPRSTVELGSTPQPNHRATEPPSQVHLTAPTTPDEATSRTTTDRRTASGRPAAPTDSPKNGNHLPTNGEKGGNDAPVGGRARVGVPDRPTAGAPTRYTELRAAVPVRVVVRKGDSLWSLAARELGPSATAEAIAARWPDWYAANRHVIGNDPDLILPGQVLRIPPVPTGDHLPPHSQEQ
ncbi:LysM peptidoglycan-binding domain-containing protein [Kribbella sindirgiensis]|uniref:LysM peptidoglycan-binding domain-containing protein n=2 Tax=Kribbella sindirgiensis TaxID=1124744 RepID=A0A4R0IUQ6_9ACTN|nr:LysM peptidoglycan-binding domain-containing protein [Kribbella sindirgiensis]